MIQLIQSGLTIPIHYKDYYVFVSPLKDFKVEVRRLGYRTRLCI